MEPFFYLASYPKSGNTWCRVFITELRRLAGLDGAEATAAAAAQERELRLNHNLATGSIVSSRHWLDDQLGIDSADLRPEEIDKLRGQVGHQLALYSESLHYHKVHDAFVSPDSGGRPVVPTECCRGAVVVIRDPANVAVSLSLFFSWPLGQPSAQLDGPGRHPGAGAALRGSADGARARVSTPGRLPRAAGRLRPDRGGGIVHAFRHAQGQRGRGGRLPGAPLVLRALLFRSGRSGEGREQLSADQLERLQAAFTPTLAAHGYVADQSPSFLSAS
jgi:hypothetical protein